MANWAQLCEANFGHKAMLVQAESQRLSGPLDPALYLRTEYGLGTPATRWASWYAETMRCDLTTEVTRIEWRYLDGAVS